MKNLLCLFLALGSFMFAHSQCTTFKFGPRIGFNTTAVALQDLSQLETYNILDKDAQMGFRVGLFARIPLGPIYLQPEALLRTASATYSVQDITRPGDLQFRDEDNLNIDLPALIGTKLLFLRVHAGPVASVRVNTRSDFFAEDGFERTFDRVNWAAQFGAGIDLWKLALDVNWQAPISSGGVDGITVAGTNYQLNKDKGQLIMSLGYSF